MYISFDSISMDKYAVTEKYQAIVNPFFALLPFDLLNIIDLCVTHTNRHPIDMNY